MIARARRLALALLLSLGVAVGLSAPLVLAGPAAAMEGGKYAAIVVDASSGEVLYANHADTQHYPASITKIMTLYLAFEQLSSGKMKMTDTIIVSPHAAAQAPSKLGLSAGERITVEDAIRAICVKSANDMAVAMAEHIGGTESRFAALMTLKAQELGMSESHFANASGLPDSRQLSSARDIAILSRAVMRDFPQYYPYFSTRTFAYRGQMMRNHNGLLFAMPGVDGIKTGFTNASGFNLAASAVRDGKRLITVVMGGSSSHGRDQQVEALLDTGFDVMRRRAAGEQITVAQNYFEHAVATPSAPTGPISYAQLTAGGASVGTATPSPIGAQAATAAYLPSRTPHPGSEMTLAQAQLPPPPSHVDADDDAPPPHVDRMRETRAHGRYERTHAAAGLKKKKNRRASISFRSARFRERPRRAVG